MREAKIVTGFTRLSDANFNTKAQFILGSMTGNPNFPSPLPDLALLAVARHEYETALLESLTRDINKVAIKNAKRAALNSILKQLALYVELVANGDKPILTSSGYDLAKEGTDTLILGTVKNFTLANGINVGQIVSKLDGVANAASYLHSCTPDPLHNDSVWVDKPSTLVAYTHDNLISGTKYWFKVSVIGRNKQETTSTILSRVAL